MKRGFVNGAQRRRWASLIPRLLLGLSAAAAMAACTGGLLEDGRARALRTISENGFQPALVKAGSFTVYSASKGRRGAGERLVVYIEGDGRSWKTRYSPPVDPTPVNPVGLDLAVRDTAPLAVYLARPCQYTRDRDRRGCHPRYWATHRFAEEVIDAMDRAIDHYKLTLGASEIELVGYSGGGAVAALIAARRGDVVGLTTVVAPLDHAAWTRHHKITPMAGSLNPADFAATLEHIPQTHFVGGDDSVVPVAVAWSYRARMTDPGKTRIIVREDYDHFCCWVRDWTTLRAQSVPR